MKKFFPYVLSIVLAFYLLPFCMVDTGSAMFILLIVTPLIVFGTSLLFGRAHGLQLLYPLLVLLLFLPCLVLHYNLSAWVYSPIYSFLALLGMWVGKVFSP